MKRLILSPHMDDESMGCGGLLAKYGPTCTIAVVADSGPTRRAEFRKAASILQVADTIEFGLPDGTVGNDMPALVARIDSLNTALRPDELFLPYPSLHQDHIAVYEAGMRSIRLSMSTDHWSPRSVFVYDVAVYDVNMYPTDLRWNTFESLTEDQAVRKAEACRCYESETPGPQHPIMAIKELAAAVGTTRGLAYAEQYALVRQVRA